MRLLLVSITGLALIAASAQAAAPRGSAAGQAEARAEFTTPSPAGYVYRRVPAPPMPTGDVSAVEVTVAGQLDAPSNPRTSVGSMGGAMSSSGAISGGPGTNVPAPMSSNRQPGGSGF
jgi:hypothetical protein